MTHATLTRLHLWPISCRGKCCQCGECGREVHAITGCGGHSRVWWYCGDCIGLAVEALVASGVEFTSPSIGVVR